MGAEGGVTVLRRRSIVVSWAGSAALLAAICGAMVAPSSGGYDPPLAAQLLWAAGAGVGVGVVLAARVSRIRVTVDKDIVVVTNLVTRRRIPRPDIAAVVVPRAKQHCPALRLNDGSAVRMEAIGRVSDQRTSDDRHMFTEIRRLRTLLDVPIEDNATIITTDP